MGRGEGGGTAASVARLNRSCQYLRADSNERIEALDSLGRDERVGGVGMGRGGRREGGGALVSLNRWQKNGRE